MVPGNPSAPSTNIIKDGINQAINERKRKIMDREEEKRKRTKEALELEKRRRIEEERMRRAKTTLPGTMA